MRNTPHYRGRVVWFSKMLGYGFLERHDGTDVLCYFDAVKNPGPGILEERDFVDYDVIQTPQGPCAANVVRFATLPNSAGPALPTILAPERQTPQAMIAMWRQGAKNVKRVMRKASLPIAKVAYMNGDYTDRLSAADIAINEQASKFAVTLDLSPNEDRRSAPYSSFLELMGLKSNLHRINFFQFRRDSWLDSEVLWRLANAPSRALEIGIRFKDGLVHTLPARLQQDRSSFWFYAIEGGEQHTVAWWRKARR